MILFSIKDLSFSVDEKKILENISFSINEGEHVTISGPSGSGKSSLLKILATLENCTSGEIFYAGKDLTKIETMSYRQEVSYCFQQAVLFGKTVRDNLAFPFEIRKLTFDEQKAIKSLEAVNLDHAFLDQEIHELSGGEKQRVALVRNLLFSPKVLLLDEVTTGLDTENKAIVRTLIKQAHQKGTTLLEVTHDSDEISLAGRIIKIEGGKIIHD